MSLTRFNEIFSDTIDTNKMVELTNSKECTHQEDRYTYFAWTEMKWKIFGDVRIYNETKKKLCKYSDGQNSILLTGYIFSIYSKAYKS